MKYGFGIDLGGTTVKLGYFDETGTMLDLRPRCRHSYLINTLRAAISLAATCWTYRRARYSASLASPLESSLSPLWARTYAWTSRSIPKTPPVTMLSIKDLLTTDD